MADMEVKLHYAGTTWPLKGTTRQDVQAEIMRLIREGGGGIAEFELTDGGTLALVVGHGVAIAVSEKRPSEAW